MVDLNALNKDRFCENCTPPIIYTVNWLIKGKKWRADKIII